MEAKRTASLIRFRGSIDIADKAMLANIAQVAGPSDVIIIDVNGLNYADTTFLRFLIGLKRGSTRRGIDAVRIVHAGKNVMRILQVTGLRSQFTFYDALGEATHEFPVVYSIPCPASEVRHRRATA